jgi:hypothetical protein
MAFYENTQDLKQDVLQKCGELTDGTSEYEDKVLDYINRAQQAMVSGAAELDIDIGEPFPWALNQYNKILILQPAITNLSVSFTNGSATATLSAAPTQNLLNWWVQPENTSETYRVAAHTGLSTTITLDSEYIETTANISATIFKTDYELEAGVLRLANPFITNYDEVILYNSDPGQIVGVDLAEFNRQYPTFLYRASTPTAFAQVYKSNDMKPTVRFNSVPVNPIRVQYNYVPVPADLTNGSPEVQTITPSLAPTAGTYILNFNGYQTTPIDWDANAYTIQSLLQDIPGLSQVSVTGTLSGIVFVSFNGYYGDAPLLTASSVSLVNGVTPVTLSIVESTPAVESIPIVPRDHRVTLVYYASYFLCMDKNDNRAAEYRELSRAGMKALVKAWKQEKITTNPDFGRMIARPDRTYDYRRSWNWWWY